MTLYGFFHTTCIYESSAALQSLHMTKASAWRAMHRFHWDAWVQAQSQKDSGLHIDRHTRQWLRECGPLHNERSHVAAVEVLP